MTTIVVTSGTVGTGKTSVATNLSVALGRLRHRVVLIDAAGAETGVAQRIGLAPHRTLEDLFAGTHGLGDLLADGPIGLRVVASSPANHEALRIDESRQLAAAIDQLSDDVDFVIIDTATGAWPAVSALATDQLLVVTTPHPRDTDAAYGLVRSLAVGGADCRVGLVVNGVQEVNEGEATYGALNRGALRFLRRSVDYCGAITADPQVRRAFMMQRAVVDCRPGAPASRCFLEIATRISDRGPSGWAAVRRVPLRLATVSTLGLLQSA